jgi:hypothetical protein
MGRTPIPLKILVHPSIDGEIFDELRAKGHSVDAMDDIASYDLVLGPNAQRMTPELVSLLDVTLTRIRREKREQKQTSK